ncbi:methylated-DNA--[protein]-cysteine S-methyltransferase [Acetivibrio saccincola]|jgi:O-6-methylguanine DNA methyltransferase|uniref:Methylated-DNA--protein-cysteine methyltransferase n=1 Tax=Acetivibrio saccincola TaxID=1677857 RepID=A0A2K9E335_9FIRM|nr:methylated-DNA--[protein]-cysteine S-methyltransferase [Acetivibrio saccincola]AUG56778.1 Methylated-DNA--protein-cysteine methyltransferase [Acetivibrio saccincola]NLW28065.1 methylated-DNA--[protein]-cysteine S-methyltransferase [Acetivibrio saccincola]PQQ66849.1 cysteine methyltransferase [Acetivibrio saccincola]HOA97442.1 methylated-DNA--[protein]-cysteine S-methyltransferase [Acetivibrio saccincola]HQD29836.1 methylated-DNA--[protein]-cysteine S-methyltransferase [Acetivibrio saccincol
MSRTEETFTGYIDTPIGLLEIKGTKKEIVSVSFTDKKSKTSCLSEEVEKCRKELKEYFEGKRHNFTCKIRLEGTDFQKKVWQELLNIGYGEVASYKEVACKIGKDNACRAVGNANNKNKISIIVPCHRVVGAGGELTGYAAGLWRKKWLLDHEKKHINAF